MKTTMKNRLFFGFIAFCFLFGVQLNAAPSTDLDSPSEFGQLEQEIVPSSVFEKCGVLLGCSVAHLQSEYNSGRMSVQKVSSNMYAVSFSYDVYVYGYLLKDGNPPIMILLEEI